MRFASTDRVFDQYRPPIEPNGAGIACPEYHGGICLSLALVQAIVEPSQIHTSVNTVGSISQPGEQQGACGLLLPPCLPYHPRRKPMG